MQRALRRTFETAGFDVAIASDGAMAMDVFRTTMPRIVILDLRLPGSLARTFAARSSKNVPPFPFLFSAPPAMYWIKSCCWSSAPMTMSLSRSARASFWRACALPSAG